MMLICMYLLSTKLDFPKKIEQFSKALLEISMMMLFSETSRFRLLLIMYYLQKYVFIDHTNSMMQINDTHQIFGFLIGLSKLVYGLYCSREHRFCKKKFSFLQTDLLSNGIGIPCSIPYICNLCMHSIHCHTKLQKW